MTDFDSSQVQKTQLSESSHSTPSLTSNSQSHQERSRLSQSSHSQFSHSQSLNSQSPNSQSPNSLLSNSSGVRSKPSQNKTLNDKSSALSTVGQLMRSVAQSVQHLYRDRLGHTPSRVTCDLVNDKLLIWAENSISRPEQMLAMLDNAQLPAVSTTLRQGLRAALIEIVERTLKVKVITLLSDICYEQNCTVMVVLLASSPRVRPSRTR